MSQQDLNVIIYKILKYLRECGNSGTPVDLNFFTEVNLMTNENQLNNALYDAWKNELIDGVLEVSIMNSSIAHPMRITKDIRLTNKGEEYLIENSLMNKIKKFLKDIKSIFG